MHKTIRNFFVLEGLDGAGTTTQLNLLRENLSGESIPFFITEEPTQNPVGKLIRRFLSGELPASQSTLARLFAADRDDHLYNPGYGIISHIEKGEAVISDRYLFSSVAYQSVGFDRNQVIEINSSFPLPALLFYIDTPLESCLSRIESRGMSREIYEKKNYLEKVKENYEHFFSQLTGTDGKEDKNLIPGQPASADGKNFRLIRIDGTLRIEEIHKIIITEIKNALHT